MPEPHPAATMAANGRSTTDRNVSDPARSEARRMGIPSPGQLPESVDWRDDAPAARWDGLLWSRPFGLCLGLLGVAAIALVSLLAGRIPILALSPSLLYMPLIAAIAYGWGGRVGWGNPPHLRTAPARSKRGPRLLHEDGGGCTWIRTRDLSLIRAAL